MITAIAIKEKQTCIPFFFFFCFIWIFFSEEEKELPCTHKSTMQDGWYVDSKHTLLYSYYHS